MSKRAADFMKNWILDNVHNVPGLTNPAPEIDRLASKLRKDAASAGFPTTDLEAAAGNIIDVLTAAYEDVHNPELGFKN